MCGEREREMSASRIGEEGRKEKERGVEIVNQGRKEKEEEEKKGPELCCAFEPCQNWKTNQRVDVL